jgi:hypothetical protein
VPGERAPGLTTRDARRLVTAVGEVTAIGEAAMLARKEGEAAPDRRDHLPLSGTLSIGARDTVLHIYEGCVETTCRCPAL